jgi:3-deoxy-D-manno-octulosonate 8-phosphate phosphatase (KDO 8-P phosphatase)
MNTEEIFEDKGGRFISAFPWFVTKASRIKAILFDWDGVFNSGAKGEGLSSSYTETDSMGTNMLRLSYWMENKTIPFVGIITGQENISAMQLGKREHFNAVYSGYLNKELAFRHLLAENNLEEAQVAYVFDDILDVAIADKCGLRLMVNNNASPLFEKFIIDNGLADYITANGGANYAVREVCELLIGITGNYNETIKERVSFNDLYQVYIAERNAIETKLFSGKV